MQLQLICFYFKIKCVFCRPTCMIFPSYPLLWQKWKLWGSSLCHFYLSIYFIEAVMLVYICLVQLLLANKIPPPPQGVHHTSHLEIPPTGCRPHIKNSPPGVEHTQKFPPLPPGVNHTQKSPPKEEYEELRTKECVQEKTEVKEKCV